MSSNFRRAILALLITAMLITGVTFPRSAAQADDPGMVVIVNALGNHIDLQVNVAATSANLWINGIPWEAVVSSAISQAVSMSAPNSQWATTDVTGWDGYYGITSNDVTITVNFDDGRPSKTFKIYRGAGCGNWGVNDGYPDSWGRRQILALAVRDAIREYQIEYLQRDQAEKAKIIASLSDNITEMSENIISLQSQTENLTIAQGNVERNYVLLADMENEKTTIWSVIWFLAIVMVIIVAIVFVTVIWSIRRKARY